MAVKNGFAHELNSPKTSVEWYTPKWVFEELNMEFDLDPASPKGGLPWIPAKQFLSIEDDGLTKNWDGTVWLNPPYGKYTAQWLEKMHKHRNGVALVFARTDCGWYHDYVVKADAILFLKGRVRFVDAKSDAGKSSPGAGSMLIAWGKDSVAALSGLREKGHFVLNG